MQYASVRRAIAETRTRPLQVRLLWLFGIVLTIIPLFAPGSGSVESMGLLVLILLQGSGIALSLRAALNRQLASRLRLAWLALAGAFAVLLISGAAYGFAFALINQGKDAGAVLVVGYLVRLLFAPIVLFAIFSFPGPATSRHDWLMHGFDLLMMLGCGAMACWYFIAGPALQAGHVSTIALLGIAEPVANLVLVSGIVLVIMRGSPPAHRRTLRHLILGVLCLVPPDLYLANQAVHNFDNFLLPTRIAVVLQAGLFLLVLAAAEQTWDYRPDPEQEYETIKVSAWSAQLPHLAVIAGYVLMIYAIRRTDFYLLGGLVIASIVMTSGTLIRQVFALREQRRLASTDLMTGLANRAFLMQSIRRAQDRGRSSGQLAAVLLFDLDGLKRVNDTLGHSAGDELLIAFARVLRRNVLGSDIVARLGGDEFVVVLHSLPEAHNAVAVAERILTDLRDPIRVAGQVTHIAASIGITITPAVGDTPAAVLRRADTAMYAAKTAGGHVWRMDLDDQLPIIETPGRQPEGIQDPKTATTRFR
jgi:diguanylate cyclase